MSWRDVYFGRQSAITRLGLIEAPKRATMSHEMTAAMELDQRQIEYAARIEREDAERLRLRRAEDIERRRRQADAEAEAAIAALPLELRARARERFGLLEELQKDEE